MPMRSNPVAVLSDFKIDFPELNSARGVPHVEGNGISKDRVQSFLEKHFLLPGGGLVSGGTPPDWQSQPSIAARQPNATVRAFALGANDVWKVLYREVNSTMFPDGKPSAKSSLIPPRFPVIVPGERFREQYYWDTLWIVRGLVRSGMNGTAKHMVENLIEFVEEYGFVPNGGRVYYLQRSQPPVLALMVEMVARMLAGRTIKPEVGNQTEGVGSTSEHYPEETGSWVRTALGALEKEYATFMGQSVSIPGVSSLQTDGVPIPTVAHATHAVDVHISSQDQLTCSDLSGREDASREFQPTAFLLNRYSSPSLRPRPESYIEDVRAAGDAGLEWNGTAASGLYRAISTGAETGWDFSSRWLGPAGTMDGCHADSIVPVDLNTIMHKMETAMARMYEGLGDEDSVTRAAVLRNNARRRATAMDCLMWDEGAGAWRDLRINVTSEPSGSSTSGFGPFEAPASGVVRANLTGQVTAGRAASDFFPLWGVGGDSGTSGGAAHSVYLEADGLVTNRTRVAAAVSGLFRSGLLGHGGVLTTTLSTGQQWDAPNSWPPVLHVVAAGLSRAASVMSAQTDGVRLGGVTSAQAGACARELSRRYLSSAACAWRATGYLFEKYDALVPCQGGGGGEYVPQRGFGWTLGVALDLLGSYRWDSLEEQGASNGGGPACVGS